MSEERTVDLSTLVPKEEAREKFDPDSRSQVIVDAIYEGGTRKDIIDRVRAHPMFADEKNWVPSYVSHNMNRLKRNNLTEEKVSRALDDYLSRTGRMTTHTSADWLIEALETEGIRLLDMRNLELQEAKVLCRDLLNFISERQGAVFVVKHEGEKPAGES